MSEGPWPLTPWDLDKEKLSPELIYEIMEYRANKLLYDRQSRTPERRKLRRAKPLLGQERIVVCGPKLPLKPTPCPICGEPKGEPATHCGRCARQIVADRRQAARTAAPAD